MKLNSWERMAIAEALEQLAASPKYAGTRGARDMLALAVRSLESVTRWRELPIGTNMAQETRT